MLCNENIIVRNLETSQLLSTITIIILVLRAACNEEIDNLQKKNTKIPTFWERFFVSCFF